MTDSWNDPTRNDPEPSTTGGDSSEASSTTSNYPTPDYSSPATPPQYEAPKYETPSYSAPEYQAGQYQAPQYQAPEYQATPAVDPLAAYGQPTGAPQADPNAAFGQNPYGATPPAYPVSGYPGGTGYPTGFDANAPVLASFGKRVQGWLVNWFILSFVLSMVTGWIFSGGNTSDTTAYQGSSFLSFALVAVVLGLLTKNGQAPGNRWAKTQIVDDQGRPVEGSKAIIRNLAHFVDNVICGIGWLFPIWDSQRQTLADKIMKTHVIDVSQTGPRN